MRFLLLCCCGLWFGQKLLNFFKMLIGILIVVAIMSLGVGGGFYFKERQSQKSLIETGVEAEKKAMELKKTIEKRYESGFDSDQ